MRSCAWACSLFVAAAGLATSGCGARAVGPVLRIGLTGFVGVEFGALEMAVPQAGPVALWLAPQAIQGPRALSGAVVELRSGSTLLARTQTDAMGVWELPERPELDAALRIYCPAGLFDSPVPAPVVYDETVRFVHGSRQPWPESPRRIPRDDIVNPISVIIEGAPPR